MEATETTPQVLQPPVAPTARTGDDVADQSENIGQLAGALAKAQGAMRNAAKDSLNPHLGSRYADLASVWDACRTALSENGLAVTQRVRTGPTYVRVITMLLHESGEWMRDMATWPAFGMRKKTKDGEEQPSGPAPITSQSLGSAITYGRRYALAALVGVAAGEEDDDGEAAATQQSNAARRKQEAPTKQPPAHTKPPVDHKKEAEAQALRARRVKAWNAASKSGMDEASFRAWATKVLGGDRPSSEWTSADLDKIEAAGPNPPTPPPAAASSAPAREPDSDDAPPAPVALAGAPDPVDVLLAELGQVDSKEDVEKLRQRSLDLVPSAHQRRKEVSDAFIGAQARVGRG